MLLFVSLLRYSLSKWPALLALQGSGLLWMKSVVLLRPGCLSPPEMQSQAPVRRIVTNIFYLEDNLCNTESDLDWISIHDIWCFLEEQLGETRRHSENVLRRRYIHSFLLSLRKAVDGPLKKVTGYKLCMLG